MKQTIKNQGNLTSAKPGYACYGVLSGGKEIVVFKDTTDIVTDRKVDGIPVACKNHKAEISFVPRGNGNQLAYEIMKNIGSNVTVGSNVEHKNKIILGDGILVYRKKKDESGKVVKEEVLADECPEIFEFIENNDYDQTRLEIANDLAIFNDAYVKYYFDKNEPPRLVQIKALETTCSLISVLDEKTGKSEWHGYSAEWAEGIASDAVATPLLDRQYTLYDLRQRMGLIPNRDGKRKTGKERMFVHNLRINTPGRFYYPRPYWWSVFASGWYDFSAAIPVYKKALIKNQMALRYIVYIRDSYWDKLYAAKQLTDTNKRTECRQQFLQDLNDFLAGEENAGKGFVSEFRYDKVKGYEEKDIIIQQLDAKQMSGGEYIEDSEEVSNTICYAMGVHPSIIGASPGKGKSINGTEARELFIIEQAMMRRYQDLTLAPLYIAKKMNGWPSDIYFEIVNCQLTTLDKGTGATKNIGMPKSTEE